MATMQVELVSIEAALWSGEANAVFGRTVDGQIGILPGHIPLIAALAPGHMVRIDRTDGESLRVAVHGGFLSVSKSGVSAELAEDIDVARAREALNSSDADGGPDEQAAHNRALARLRAAGEEV